MVVPNMTEVVDAPDQYQDTEVADIYATYAKQVTTDGGETLLAVCELGWSGWSVSLDIRYIMKCGDTVQIASDAYFDSARHRAGGANNLRRPKILKSTQRKLVRQWFKKLNDSEKVTEIIESLEG
jgi:hypothetical protein